MKTKMYKFRNQHISKLTNLLIMMLISSSIFAQAPQKMSYQAVIRDASGLLVANHAVGMQISILQGSAGGNAVYLETQTPTSNANGLVSLEIGSGTVVSGDFTTIDWANGPYFIKTETDPTGGTSYTIAGTSQLLSVPYALSAGNVTGLEKITEGANTGWRLIGRDPTLYGNIGSNATDLSFSFLPSSTNGATGNFSAAMGDSTTASGTSSTAMGFTGKASGFASTAMGWSAFASGDSSTSMGSSTRASGAASTAMGSRTRASGGASTAMGDNTNASGDTSTAMGINTIASGDISTVMGSQTIASSFISTAMGRYNIGGGNATSWVATDPLFEIGNGSSFSNRSNALTISKNGNTYVNGNTDVSGVLRASGKTWPTTGAGVEIAYDKDALAGFGVGFIQSFDRNSSEWKQLVIGASDLKIRAESVFPDSDNFSSLGLPSKRWAVVYAVNGTIQTSDRRMKKNIKDLNYGLNTVLQLRPVSYKWKKGNQDVNLGLIAQDVQKLIPEMVDVGTDENKTLGMNYSELIPVLIKAVQEQQKIIENQQNLMASQQEVNAQQQEKISGQQEVTASQQTEIDELKGLVNKLLKKNKLLAKN